MTTTWVVKKFANHLDLATFLTATPAATIDAVLEWQGVILVYH